MGDRANILVVDEPAQNGTVNGIYLYTHWSGYRWPETLRAALDSANARRRWRDGPYLTRIIVSQVFSDIHEGEIGGGISTRRTDNEHPIIILDIPNQRVAWALEGSELDTAEWYGHMTFSEFCAQDTAQWPGGPGARGVMRRVDLAVTTGKCALGEDRARVGLGTFR